MATRTNINKYRHFMDDATLITILYIKNAPNREKVLKSFKGEDYLIPIQIAKRLNLHLNAVSKNLKDLREHDLVYVIIQNIIYLNYIG